MYNNFSSKKTKKVISALLASALVVTAAPITADAATTKVLGVSKTFSIAKKASAKVSGLSKAEKNIVKVTISKNKKKVTVKGKKAGTVKFKVGSKSYTVKVGATSFKKVSNITLTAGKSKKVTVTANNGAKDTLKWTSSKKSVATVSKATTTATAKKTSANTIKAVKAGTTTITVASKYTGKKITFKVTVKAATATATPATPTTTPTSTPSIAPSVTPATTPAVSATPEATATVTPATTPAVSATPEATATPSADVTTTPAITATPSADVTTTPVITATPSADVTTTPAITATPSAIEFTAKQTGAKKIVITNPTAMSKTDITIKRGSSTVPVEKIVFTDDSATTAEVTLTGSIVAVEYTISVGDNSVKFTGEASKVENVEITSDVVAMNGKVGETGTTTGTVNYKVTNQFGEDITATTSIEANSSASKAEPNTTKGYVTITWGTEPRLNDVVSLVLIYKETGISTSKVLTVKDQAAPAEVEVYGVYNEDGKKLTATNAGKEEFYYLFRVKDQYGNYMDSTKVNKTNLMMNVAPGLTNIELDEDNATTVAIDGVNYIAYPIDIKTSATSAAAGEVTVMLIPSGSGKTSITKFNVENGNTVVTFSASVSGSIPSGGTVDLDYVALDENGDDVTSYRVLKEITSSNENFEWVKENGAVVLRYTDPNTLEGSAVSTVFTLPSYETKLVTINIKAAREAASIGSLNSDLSTATLLNRNITVEAEDFNLVDQYGNSYDNTIWDGTTALAGGELAVMVEAENEDGTNFSVSNATGLKDVKYTTDANVDLNDISGTNAKIITGNDSGVFRASTTLCSKNITFKLVKYSATGTNGGRWVDYTASSTTSKTNYTQTGAYTATFTATKESKFVSYKVNDINTLLVGGTGSYQKEVTVKGVLNNGKTVDLVEGTDFSIEVDDASAKFVDVSNGKLVGQDTGNELAPNSATTDVTSKDCSYKITINSDGTVINKKVKVSTDDPTVKEIKFKSDSSKGINVATILANSNAKEGTINVSDLVSTIKAVDSYGVDAISFVDDVITLENGSNPAKSAKFTISDIDSVNGVVADNGTNAPTLTKFAKGDSFTLTIICEDATFTTVVSVKDTITQAEYDAAAADAAIDTYVNSLKRLATTTGVIDKDNGASIDLTSLTGHAGLDSIVVAGTDITGKITGNSVTTIAIDVSAQTNDNTYYDVTVNKAGGTSKIVRIAINVDTAASSGATDGVYSIVVSEQ